MSNNLQREHDRWRKVQRSSTQQDGKVGEVVAFAHCHRGIGEGIIPVTPSVRPLPNSKNGIL